MKIMKFKEFRSRIKELRKFLLLPKIAKNKKKLFKAFDRGDYSFDFKKS